MTNDIDMPDRDYIQDPTDQSQVDSDEEYRDEKEGKRAASSGVILLASPSKGQKARTTVRTAYFGEEWREYQVVVSWEKGTSWKIQ